MAGIRFRILGPLEVWAGDTRLNLRGPRQERCLAAMLLEPGQMVTIDALVDATWDDPPPTARRQVQDLVGGLRRLLVGHGGGPGAVTTHRAGYLLDVGTSELDALQFEDLTAAGRRAASSDIEGAARMLRSALALCRGETLAGIGSRALEPAVARWEERRRTVREEWLALEMELGNHGLMMGELIELASAYPLRERPAALLMRALYAVGRAPEALEVFQRLRRRLADDLGLEPGADLRELQRTILGGAPIETRDPVRVVAAEPAPDDVDASTPGITSRPTGFVPAQLPPDVRGFAGRAAELARLDEIAFGRSGHPGAVVIAALAGTAGIGKTALAIHWAHRAAGRFPDGQLYVNLRGFDPGGGVLRPADAVRGFLDALRVPAGQVPSRFEAQVGLYRSLLADKRMLVMLDNARDAEQVRPLLPGAAGCMVVVTSRNQLGGLVAAEGAHSITLGLLTLAEARHLLADRLGEDVVRTQQDAVDAIIAACERLPLALAIVAARAATSGGLPLSDLAAQLEATSLDAFSVGDPAVDLRPVFSWSYDLLSPAAERLFRLLGLHPGGEFGVRLAAGMADVAMAQATSALAELVRAHLITQPAPGRYGMHDLLRAYATERAHGHTGKADREAALVRMLDYFLHSAHAAAQLFRPGRAPVDLAAPQPGALVEAFDGRLDAQAWLAREHAQLVAAVDLAAGNGLAVHAWQIAWALEDFLDSRADWDAMLHTQDAALRAAIAAGDRLGEASAHSGLGHACCMRREFDRAQSHLQTALELHEEAGDRRRQVKALLHMALLHCYQDRSAEALAYARGGLPFLAECPPVEQAYLLSGLCWFHGLAGDHEQALAYGRQALDIFETADDPGFRGNLIEGMAYINCQLGKHTEAIALYEDALAGYRNAQLLLAEARTLGMLGDAYEEINRTDEAVGTWKQAIPILDRLDPAAAAALRDRIESLPQPRA